MRRLGEAERNKKTRGKTMEKEENRKPEQVI